MRIAFVVGVFPSLSQTFVLNQMVGLIERGHDLRILSFNAGEHSVRHPDVDRYGLLDRTTYLDTQEPLSRLKSAPGRAVACAGHADVLLRSLNVLKYGRAAVSLRLFSEAASLLACGASDIVHCQFGTWGLRYLPLHEMGAGGGGKLIVNFRGYDISETVQLRGTSVYRHLFARSDYLITNCEFFRSRLLEIGAPADRLAVIPSGIACSRFPFAERVAPADGVTRIAMVGRLVEKKGTEYALRAVAELVNRGKNVQCQVVGDGPLRASLSRLLVQLKLERHVRLSGSAGQGEVIDTLARSHLFVAPSITTETGNQEGSINVLKEAMAMGIPVVSTFHAGVPEVVQDGISGLLAPERDSGALADRLQYLIEHPEVWPTMGRNGRAFVESHFDIDPLNEQLIDVYRRVLSSA